MFCITVNVVSVLLHKTLYYIIYKNIILYIFVVTFALVLYILDKIIYWSVLAAVFGAIPLQGVST